MNRSHYTRRMGKQRRGLSTPVMLMGVMSALLFIVLTIDLAQLSLQRQEMQVGADAATIAAVPELMDRRWLYLGPEGGSQSPQAIVAWTDSLPEQQAAAALAQAQLFAASNQVASQPIELEEECVAFGYVSDPTSGNPDMEPPGTVDHYNSIGIEIKRSPISKNPPVLWLARQTGLDSIDVLVRSQACVDTRIHGFKPLDHVNVPLVPLGLFKYRGEGANSHSSGSTSASGYPGGSENMPAQIW